MEQEVAQPEPVVAADAPVKMEETSSDIKNMSEEDLLKLRKINFKKKVSGEICLLNLLFDSHESFLLQERRSVSVKTGNWYVF
jgi:hypothetical protein